MFDRDYLLFFVFKIIVKPVAKCTVHTVALVNKCIYKEATSLSACYGFIIIFCLFVLFCFLAILSVLLLSASMKACFVCLGTLLDVTRLVIEHC